MYRLYLRKQFTNKLGPVTELFRVSRTPTSARRPWYSHAYILSFFGPIMSNHRRMPKTKIVGALVVASGLLNSYMKFHQDFKNNDWVMSQKPWPRGVDIVGHSKTISRWIGIIGPKEDQIWTWLYHGHWWAVGVQDNLKMLVTDPRLLVNCYLESKLNRKFSLPKPHTIELLRKL